MNLFFDTSALIKLYHQEPGTNNLINSLHRYADNLAITITDLSIVECHSALMKHVRIGDLSLEKAKKAFTQLELEIEKFYLVEIDVVTKGLAIELIKQIAYQRNLGTLDAMQLAAAILSHQVVAIDYFVVCDKRLLNFAKQYFNTFNPENDEI